MALQNGRHAMRVTSYNVLSPSLCSASHFLHCDPSVLQNNRRWATIESKLEAETERNAVVCLQELSLSWTSKCHEFFNKRRYHMINCNYGKPFNGYMGVTIAFPTEKYDLVDCRIACISDSKVGGYQRDNKRSPRPGLMEKIWNMIRNQLYPVPKDEDKEAWNNARIRHNQMVMVKLRSKEEESVSFCVGTYHMPCAYWAPKIMTIHAALAAQELCRFANNLPMILAGDFNFAPGSAQYNLITTGSLSETDPTYPAPCFENDKWKPEIPVAFKSAYQVVNGSEPQFTNYAFVRGNEQAFVDTLDYIFYHPGGKANGIKFNLEATAVDELLDKETTLAKYKSFPSDTEPSDHIAVGANFEVTTEV